MSDGDKIIYDEEKVREFCKSVSEKEAEAMRNLMDMQQELIREYAKPFIQYAHNKLQAIPKDARNEIKEGIYMMVTLHAGVIASNILLNMPGFNKENFLKQLDDMIELSEKNKDEENN